MRWPVNQHIRPWTITSRASTAKRGSAGGRMRLASVMTACPSSSRSSASMSSSRTRKPARIRLIARSRLSALTTAWHGSAKLPTFMRRVSSPKNSSSSSRATASHRAENASAVTRAWGEPSTSSGTPATRSTRPRAGGVRRATAAATKCAETVPLSMVCAAPEVSKTNRHFAIFGHRFHANSPLECHATEKPPMTDLSAEYKALAEYRPTNKVRFVTAASLFDGHDAAINIMRRILQGMGAEVIHLGHNRSVDEVVTAALQEDAQGIAISSYQGGHVEYFKYMVDLLKSRGGEHIQVFGGGGGVIVPAEIAELQGYGVARIYSPEDGQRMGLAGMIGEMVMRGDVDLSGYAPKDLAAIQGREETHWRALAQLVTALENGKVSDGLKTALHAAAKKAKTPVLGITGTGGAGKSSLTDELIRRLRLDQGDRLHIAVISIDPSRRKSGGALLGDRIRMNAIGPWSQASRVFMRSLAT